MKRKSSVKIRRIWENTNSQKDQVTVMLAQEVENTASNVLIAAAQGSDSFGPSFITTLVSFAKAKAIEYFGTTDADYSAGKFEDWPEPTKYVEAVGNPIAISVQETLVPNPNLKNPNPKVNPSTGEILCLDGKPIYRHTELVLAGDEQTILLKHNTVTQTDAFAEEKGKTAAEAFALAGASAVEEG